MGGGGWIENLPRVMVENKARHMSRPLVAGDHFIMGRCVQGTVLRIYIYTPTTPTPPPGGAGTVTGGRGLGPLSSKSPSFNSSRGNYTNRGCPPREGIFLPPPAGSGELLAASQLSWRRPVGVRALVM